MRAVTFCAIFLGIIAACSVYFVYQNMQIQRKLDADAVGIPQRITRSERLTCRANMMTIANAVQATRVKAVAADYGKIIAAGINALAVDLGGVPECPAGGTYNIAFGDSGDKTTFKVTCTFPEHGTFEPGVDAD